MGIEGWMGMEGKVLRREERRASAYAVIPVRIDEGDEVGGSLDTAVETWWFPNVCGRMS